MCQTESTTDRGRVRTGDDDHVLLVGGSGFIGRSLTERLVDCGATVDVVDVDPSSATGAGDGRITVFEGDVTDYERMVSLFRERDPDTVVLLAYLLGAETEADPTRALGVNIRGPDTVFRAAGETGVDRAVFTSSMAVYGLPDTFDGPIAEDALAPAAYAQYPVMLYAATKQFNEYQAKHYADSYDELSVVSVRPSTVFGPGREAGYTSWTSDIVTEPVAGGVTTIPHRRDRRLSLVPRFDAAALFAQVSLAESVDHDAYNTGGHCVTVDDLADRIETVLGGEVRCDPDEPGAYPHVANVSHDRAREAFGYDLTPLDDALERLGRRAD